MTKGGWKAEKKGGQRQEREEGLTIQQTRAFVALRWKIVPVDICFLS